MTEHEIGELKAGPETDAAVAEKVMGWSSVGYAQAWAPDGDWGIAPKTTGVLRPFYMRHCCCDVDREFNEKWSEHDEKIYGVSRMAGHCLSCLDVVPEFSTDPAAAAQVKRWLWERGLVVEVTSAPGDKPVVGVWLYGGPFPDGACVADAPVKDGDCVAAECLCLARAAIVVASKAAARREGE